MAGLTAPGAVFLFASRPHIKARIKRAKAKGAVLLQEMAGEPIAIQSLHLRARSRAAISCSFSLLFLTATLM